MKTMMIAMAGASLLLVFGAGCKTQVVETRQYGPDGTMTSHTKAENNKVLYDLKRVLEKETIRGTGKYTAEMESEARLTALNLAINDLAMKAGEVIASSDLTYYKGETMNIVRTQGRNVVKGYDVIFEKWDAPSKTYTVEIEMRGYKMAEEIVKYIR
jgi:hypothetical protein